MISRALPSTSAMTWIDTPLLAPSLTHWSPNVHRAPALCPIHLQGCRLERIKLSGSNIEVGRQSRCAGPREHRRQAGADRAEGPVQRFVDEGPIQLDPLVPAPRIIMVMGALVVAIEAEQLPLAIECPPGDPDAHPLVDTLQVAK
jgi:hypothetical protein